MIIFIFILGMFFGGAIGGFLFWNVCINAVHKRLDEADNKVRLYKNATCDAVAAGERFRDRYLDLETRKLEEAVAEGLIKEKPKPESRFDFIPKVLGPPLQQICGCGHSKSFHDDGEDYCNFWVETHRNEAGGVQLGAQCKCVLYVEVA
jgi:hypothetical protein